MYSADVQEQINMPSHEEKGLHFLQYHVSAIPCIRYITVSRVSFA